ncbi:MAG: hypothetical protein PHT07_18295 [Paludibacter sp.]|nr:hypothetical protein [Paludibacter sp.]
MRVFISVIFLVVFSSIVFAQQAGLDSVYLKSGSLVIGTISQSSTDERIEIKTRDNRIYHYSMNAVFKISKSRIPGNSKNANKINTELAENRRNNTDTINEHATEIPTIKTINKSYLIVDMGYGLGIHSRYANLLQLDVINSYTVTRNFNLGVGAGYRFYYKNMEYGKAVPVYADLRFLLNPHHDYNFFTLDLGYSFGLSDGVYPVGYYVNPSINFGAKMGNSDYLTFGVGLEVQNTSINSADNLYNLVFKVGYMFNCK